ncbi:hypothetical protein DQ04_00551020 [Trypanosoma grayi]|uniref:hypothetical protein n=1 Tax=Trypanosoma grayi TaxID=71804 RepID=UPI0004F42D68|nr:hypothetical protein DQ04_00551020 [Trypanosoma grayi]KEG14250.1 hypothetical protein DQ04_00551020 [Trypanosoma grayi]
MWRNVETAGVHLADCTLLGYRGDLALEQKRAEAEAQKRHNAPKEGGPTKTNGTTAKQLASPFIRVDEELIASSISLSAMLRAEAERKAHLTNKIRHEEEREALLKLHDGMRSTIIDSWALELERLKVTEQKAFRNAQCRERSRRVSQWREAAGQQHLADEARLWADMEQVMMREREEGRAAHRQRNTTARN